MLVSNSNTNASSLGVFRLLEERPSRSQREIATELGVSLGKVNYLLQALLDTGFIKVRNLRSSSNKKAYLYLLTPAGIAAKADLTRRFLAGKLQKFDVLSAEIERLRAEMARE